MNTKTENPVNTSLKQEVNDPPKKGIYIVGINTSAPLPCVPCNNSNKTQSNKYIG